MHSQPQSARLQIDDKLHHDGELVSVVAIRAESAAGVDCIIKSGSRGLVEVHFAWEEVAKQKLPSQDGQGSSPMLLTSLWSRWMEYATPRIRSAVFATKPLKPFAHQDDAVFGHMLPQPRLRYLLADEPGTGKTMMTGMYIAEGRRRGLVPGKAIIVVPAHLVEKWLRDLRRYFAIEAMRITPEIGREPQDLRPDIDIWVVSVDLFTHNLDVRRKIVGARASWSLAVFDEAHRLTPTSQYLGAGQQLSQNAHHLLLLTATPHRGKEHYFRALLNLLDPALYPWSESQQSYSQPLRPSNLSFLRRMKEDLKDLTGEPLFPARYAETRSIDLTVAEADAYDAVMAYVDDWYDQNAVLARSIYGKRAASSITAALETLKRRAIALKGSHAARVAIPPPHGFDNARFDGADLDDDEAWGDAERSVVEARSQDRRAELEVVQHTIERLETALKSADEPAKWHEATALLAKHGIQPGPNGGQLLVFTEFTDTARWLVALFKGAGYSTELLEGSADHLSRDDLQQRFLNGAFQVLVSTDAGGEGIDLQSAYVMLNWDIPWSLVRLEQRMGRLHRIGQRKDVHIYHLVAPRTREGRVQTVMLQNLSAASSALGGRIFDLLDATAANAGFNYGAALAEAQRSTQAGEAAAAAVPDTADLIARAQEIVTDEDRLKSPATLDEAQVRFAQDRLESINPVIVDAFLRQVASVEGWTLQLGPANDISLVRSAQPLPAFLGGTTSCLVAADARAVSKARAEGFGKANEVVVLGPTEDAFRSLVRHAAKGADGALYRGGALVDRASLTSYTLFVFETELEYHDGVRRLRQTTPFLVRYSGQGAFSVAWESIMNLAPSDAGSARPEPAARLEAEAAARTAVEREVTRMREERSAWVDRAMVDLEGIERRYRAQLRALSAEARHAQIQGFLEQRETRTRQLEGIRNVGGMAPRLVGWVSVAGGAGATEMGHDPNSEKIAVAAVVAELERLDFVLDDRQTAGLGYDLLAVRRPLEQRLVEVKGFTEGLRAVAMEPHEWAQAQQRGEEYWLYVVVNCGVAPTIVVRLQDPAAAFPDHPKTIARVQIPVSLLKKHIRG